MELTESHITYIGCLGVITSMRSLSHRTRSEVTKESIKRLCVATRLIDYSARNYDDDISSMLASEPNLLFSGTRVRLKVTSTHLNIISEETNQIIIQHVMPDVSFASEASEDSVDFVAYVAKDTKFNRSCFVLRCGKQTAKSVLEVIARGFNERSQQLLYNSGTLGKATTNGNNNNDNSLSLHHQHQRWPSFDGASSTDSSNQFGADHHLAHPNNNENLERNDNIITLTRASLKGEPWYHGPISRDESETRLKRDGDFLVREEDGEFVLSVMHDNVELHILFDSINQIRTRGSALFQSINHYIYYLLEQEVPIVTPDNRTVYLRTGLQPPVTKA